MCLRTRGGVLWELREPSMVALVVAGVRRGRVCVLGRSKMFERKRQGPSLIGYSTQLACRISQASIYNYEPQNTKLKSHKATRKALEHALSSHDKESGSPRGAISVTKETKLPGACEL